MIHLDTGICLEFLVTTTEEIFPVIYRPRNLKELTTMLKEELATQIKEEYKAAQCELTHIYIKGRTNDEKYDVEFSIGNKQEIDVEMYLIET